MNTFPGTFPDGPTGPVGTVAADSFPPNGYGLHNMTGNVWEWTTSPFRDDDPRPVVRGGSYMCHASYCRRYRTSARTAVTPDTSLGHTGFRLAVTPG
jgi:formylglycine-generating enzyme required for sulfatase activity